MSNLSVPEISILKFNDYNFRINEIAEFLNLNVDDLLGMGHNAAQLVRDRWNESDPQTKEERIHWYSSCWEYLLDLTAYNTIAQEKQINHLLTLSLARGNTLVFGGGVGDLSIFLALSGRVTTYCDLPGTTMEFFIFRLKRLGLDGTVRVLASGGSTDTLGNRKFDTICCFDVLEHLDDVRGTIEMFSRSLDIGGRLLCDGAFAHTELHPMHLSKNDHWGAVPSDFLDLLNNYFVVEATNPFYVCVRK